MPACWSSAISLNELIDRCIDNLALAIVGISRPHLQTACANAIAMASGFCEGDVDSYREGSYREDQW